MSGGLDFGYRLVCGVGEDILGEVYICLRR